MSRGSDLHGLVGYDPHVRRGKVEGTPLGASPQDQAEATQQVNVQTSHKGRPLWRLTCTIWRALTKSGHCT